MVGRKLENTDDARSQKRASLKWLAILETGRRGGSLRMMEGYRVGIITRAMVG
jgi:hypothetical protein